MEAPDFEPKAAPGTPNGPTGASKTPKGIQGDEEYIARLPINCPIAGVFRLCFRVYI